MKKIILLIILTLTFFGCGSTGYYNLSAGGTMEKGENIDVTGITFGLNIKQMYTNHIGYNIHFTSIMPTSISANNNPIEIIGAGSGLGCNIFVAPSFKVFDIGERISFNLSPGLASTILIYDGMEGYQNVASRGIGFGLDLSSAFYFGNHFYMRIGTLLSIEGTSYTFEKKTNDYIGISKNYKSEGIYPQFNIYPSISIGWRTGEAKKKLDEQRKINDPVKDVFSPPEYDNPVPFYVPEFSNMEEGLWFTEKELLSSAKEALVEMQLIETTAPFTSKAYLVFGTDETVSGSVEVDGKTEYKSVKVPLISLLVDYKSVKVGFSNHLTMSIKDKYFHNFREISRWVEGGVEILHGTPLQELLIKSIQPSWKDGFMQFAHYNDSWKEYKNSTQFILDKLLVGEDLVVKVSDLQYEYTYQVSAKGFARVMLELYPEQKSQ